MCWRIDSYWMLIEMNTRITLWHCEFITWNRSGSPEQNSNQSCTVMTLGWTRAIHLENAGFGVMEYLAWWFPVESAEDWWQIGWHAGWEQMCEVLKQYWPLLEKDSGTNTMKLLRNCLYTIVAVGLQSVFLMGMLSNRQEMMTLTVWFSLDELEVKNLRLINIDSPVQITNIHSYRQCWLNFLCCLLDTVSWTL